MDQELRFVRNNSDDFPFQYMVSQLDAYLVSIYGAEQEYYNQFNKLNKLNTVIVTYKSIGCGAIKEY
jgi:putative acetyltransferase